MSKENTKSINEPTVSETFLSQLKPGESGIIVKIKGHGAFRKRITEMGFIKGKKVSVIKQAPLSDPMEYHIIGYNVSLRKSEARLIQVVQDYSSPEKHSIQNTTFLKIEEKIQKVIEEKSNIINIALVGNPNCGKTTLFNYATGAHERVGNYGGVTVESKEGVINKDGYTFKLCDLPGTYSITEYTPEEVYVRNHLIDTMPDVVVNIIDASNLERNLYLTTQLIDMNIKVVVALNMYDELEQKGIKLNHKKLGKLLGTPIIPTVASQGKGVDNLLKKIIEVYEDKEKETRHIHINHGNEVEQSIRKIQEAIKEIRGIGDFFSTRYLAIKLFEKDKITESILEETSEYEKINRIRNNEVSLLEEQYGEDSESIITDAKYGFIGGALKECMTLPENSGRKVRELDDLLTHKYLGVPIFIFLMWLMFQATFSLGNYPMSLIEYLVGLASDFLTNTMIQGPLRDLLVNGIIDGVGGVLVFLPNILILFFFISLMEDSGYMARAAFIMDKVMHKIGLHGKSFIPLVMGFGCNVPAVMATRTLECRKDRILTMLLVPFMSCSARLPVYILLISAFFPNNKGLVLFSIYMTGILMAIILSLLLKKLIFKKQEVPFVMELPPYRIPTLKSTVRHMWHKGHQYLKKMGSVILAASIIVWALGYFPMHFDNSSEYNLKIRQIASAPNMSTEQKNQIIANIETEKNTARLENSYIGRLGHFISPIMEPLGFDWKMGVSIISGLPAKEIVVSTMSVLYQAESDNNESLIAGIKAETHKTGEKEGKKVFNPIVALAFMVFILLYFPCIATIVAIGKESGWEWAVFSLIYTTTLAWIMAFIVYNIGNLIINI